jgi:hypothetical protein
MEFSVRSALLDIIFLYLPSLTTGNRCRLEKFRRQLRRAGSLLTRRSIARWRAKEMAG